MTSPYLHLLCNTIIFMSSLTNQERSIEKSFYWLPQALDGHIDYKIH